MVMRAVGTTGCATSSAGWQVILSLFVTPVVSIRAPTLHLLHILDAHATGEQGNRQKETDQQHRDEHQHPGQ